MQNKISIFFLTLGFTFILIIAPSCKQSYCGPPKNKTTDTTTPPVNTSCKVNVYLQMNGNTNDNSTYANNVIQHGNFSTGTGKNGVANGSIYFNGSNNYLEIPHSANFSGNAIAVMAWLKPTAFGFYSNGITSLDAYSGFFNKWDDATRKGISTYSTYKQTRLNGHYSDNFFFDYGPTPGSFLSTNTWQHVAYVVSNGVIKLYLNGALVGSSSTGGSTTNLLTINTPIEIGRTKWYPSSTLMLSYFTGYIDELKIYYNCPNIDISKEM